MSSPFFFIAVCLILVLLYLWLIKRLKHLLSKTHELKNEIENLSCTLRLLSEHSSDISFRYDLKGLITQESQNFQRVTGHDISKNHVTIYDILTENPLNEKFRTHLQKEVKQEGTKTTIQVEIYDGFGKGLLLELLEKPEYSTEGQLKWIDVVAKDVTLAIKTEKTLKESRNQLKHVLKAIPDAIFMIDREYRYRSFQTIDEDKLWQKSKEFEGEKVFDVVPKPLGNFLEKHMELSFKTGKKQIIEYQMGEGKERCIYKGRLIKLSEDFLLVASSDITAEKLANEELIKAERIAEETQKAKKAFFATMSHEIRTPLNGVVGTTNILMNSSIDEKQYETLEILKASSDSLLRTINDVLDYSRIESGSLDFKESLFYLNKLVEESLSLIKFEASKKGILLSSNYNDDVPQFIRTDEARLRQIISNLLYNAIKFTESGSISIEVSCLKKLNEYLWLNFKVQDTGIGIPKEKQHQLFEEFTQVDNSYDRQFSGSGLGLAIVKKLVQLMEGDVSVQSEVNKGSSFEFTIKVRVASSMNNTDNQENTGMETDYIAGEHPMKLLLVEDNDINRKLIVIYLERLGYVADIAKDGIEALQMVSKNTYETILLDISMPKMDGFQVVQEIQKLEDKAKPYIIGISANAFKEDVSKAHEVGMNDYIIKPIYFKDLKERLLKAHSLIK